tara:strand:- start:1822 stop:2082 length:261 start_codon:yes stop_codon:yes gene_type:complete
MARSDYKHKVVNGQIVDLTEAEIDDCVASEEAAAADLAANGYKDNRRKAYGDLGDQLDMQYKDQLNGTTTWKDHVTKVKSDHPKPE